MQQVDVTALQDFVAQRATSSPVLLDVREPWEVALGRIDIAGARSMAIPMNEIPGRLGEIDRSDTIVCICHHGMRSAQVANFLERQGYSSVFNLSGGTDAWSTQVDPQLPRY
ncbi:rhodanese-like domain-containing protein [Piscinibacter sakaiensis]|uniref:rhodanese-like domain-containing protein n=1 Tax=Piscinibacter sakaiensis TaxID=1547922 RepID=UPI003AAE78E6